jgi:hypothetical protein
VANATKTVKSSGGDYTSLNAALAGLSGNLTTNCAGTGGAGILTIECYYLGSADSTAASTGTGYTTSADYYINITVPTAERHSGVWSTSKYYMSQNELICLDIRARYVKVIGLQFYKGTAGSFDNGAIWISSGSATSSVLIDSCILKGPGIDNAGNYTSAIQQNYGDETTVEIRNTLIYDWIGDTSSKTAAIWCYLGTFTVYNVTIVDSYVGIGNSGGTINCTNLGMSGVTTATYGTVGQTTGSTTTPTFVNAASDNFHLASNDTTWHNQGTDLSGTFTTDIDGETRATWDIGADEYVAAGGASIPLSNPFSRPFRQSLGRGGF